MALQRFLVDGTTPNTARTFSEFVDHIPRAGRILEKKSGEDKIVVLDDTVLALNNLGYKSFIADGDVELSVSDLDTGSSFTVGRDYYVYLCDDGASGVFLISEDATFPDGYSAESSRKIGGFHYGHTRVTNGMYIPTNTSGVAFGSGWENNVTIGVIPNSVWDLSHRPKCSPEGMAKVGDSLWVDIYQASAAETVSLEGAGLHVSAGALQSKYGQYPLTGTEGLNWYNFAELAGRAGKRVLSYEEWIQAAFGNPEGEDSADNYGWTKTANSGRARTGCEVDPATGDYADVGGIKPYAVSAHNIVDTVGNVWEWLGNMLSRWDSGTDWGWQDVLGSNKGELYAYNESHLVAMLAGGYWADGVIAGARAAYLIPLPWSVNTSFGCRLACDSL